MNKLPDAGNVSEWQRLMLQWEVAHTNYQAVLDAYRVLGNLEGHSKERDIAEQKALTELKAIKEKIDHLIRETSLRRKPSADFLVVGVLAQDTAGSVAATNYPKNRGATEGHLKVKSQRRK
jgi:hypothetical protein